MIICSANQIGLSIHDGWLFRNLSVDVQEQARIAIIGPNGAGKTTLVKLLAGSIQPDEGQVAWKKGVQIGYLAQLPVYDATTSVADVLRTAFAGLHTLEQQLRQLEVGMASAKDTAELNRMLDTYAKAQEEFEERGGYEMESKTQAVVFGLQIPVSLLDTPFVELSGGEQTKVGFARLLLSEPELLLLDEPTNHLDLPSIEWLEGYLLRYAGAVVVISHDRVFIDHVAGQVLELDNGEITVYEGGYSKAIQQREERLLQEFQAYQEQQKKVQQMQAAIKRLRDWANRSNPPSAGLHRRATNMQRALDRMVKMRRPILERKRMGLAFQTQERSGQDVVVISNVVKQYGPRVVLDHVNLHLRYGERAAVVGANGAGKSTILRLILGTDLADAGVVRVGESVRIGYLSQHGLEGYSNVTVLEAFRDVVLVSEGQARHLLAKFLFYGQAAFQRIESLSGGERMRLRLAQLMHQDVNLLVLDEPTNHLDIESREVLEDALEDFSGTILAVSHDRHFINRLFERVLWLENGSVTPYLGNYDEARAKRLLMQS